jgi:hypothetical protein
MPSFPGALSSRRNDNTGGDLLPVNGKNLPHALLILICVALLPGCGSAPTTTGSTGGSSGNTSGASGGTGGTGGQNGACKVLSTGVGASLNGFVPFPGDNAWNQDISNAAVDPNSTAIISFIGSGVGLHPDFGAGQYQGSNMGIPYVVVNGLQPLVSVNFTAYGNESDPGPMPIPGNAPVEGDPNPGNGTVMCWSSIMVTVSYMNSSVHPPTMMERGTLRRLRFGICRAMNSGHGPGPRPMQRACQFSPD